jgi:Amidases related to nicotinamidase
MKKALIVVDYQIDFVSAALGFPGAEKLEEPIANLIDKCLEEGYDLIFTMDTHDRGHYMESEEGKHLPVPHCFKGEDGWKPYGKIAAYLDRGKVFEKPTFGSLELGNYLSKKEYDEIELCGLVSNICVLSNAVIAKAALPDAHVSVHKNLTDSFDKKLNAEVMDVLSGIQVELK